VCLCVCLHVYVLALRTSLYAFTHAEVSTFPPFVLIVRLEYRLWSLQQAGAIGILELPSQAQGDPHVAFDSTGLVFGITAAMTAGQGHVSVTVGTYSG
jgi:hypothetical protein